MIDDLATLAVNTTQHLVRDMEVLREHLGVERWLLVGSSWGTTLALAYAQSHPERVTEVALLAATLTDAAAVQWITETGECIFPMEWDEFRAQAKAQPGQRVVDAYYRLLTDSDPIIRERAAVAWDRWENAHVSLTQVEQGPRASDPARRQVFCTLVTHYWVHAAFLAEGQLINGMSTLRDIPAVLVHGRLDVSGPAGTPWLLHKLWPGSRFILIEDEGHGGHQWSPS